MSRADRVARLMEAWRVLLLEWEQARRWRDRMRLQGLATALKIIDACIAIEDGAFAERDKFGSVTNDPDVLVLARLREISAARNILKGFGPEEADPAPTSDEVGDVAAAPEPTA